MKTERYSRSKVTPFEKTIAAKLLKVSMIDRALILARECLVAPGYIDKSGNPVPFRDEDNSAGPLDCFVQGKDAILMAWAKHPQALILMKAPAPKFDRLFVYDGTQMTSLPAAFAGQE